MFTLSQVISGEKILNEEQISSFMKVFGKYCQMKRWNRLKSVITYPTCADNWRIYEQVQWKGDDCRLYAAQDYTVDLRAIRELLTK